MYVMQQLKRIKEPVSMEGSRDVWREGSRVSIRDKECVAMCSNGGRVCDRCHLHKQTCGDIPKKPVPAGTGRGVVGWGVFLTHLAIFQHFIYLL